MFEAEHVSLFELFLQLLFNADTVTAVSLDVFCSSYSFLSINQSLLPCQDLKKIRIAVSRIR